MKNKFIKILLVIILLVSLSFISFKHIEYIKADSGWDTDYDSSWDSGSDWGDSSWDNDYDYDDWDSDDSWSGSSSSGGSYSGDASIVFLPLAIIIVFTIVVAISSSVKNKKTNISAREKRRREYVYRKNISYNYVKLPNDKANKVIPNFDIEEFNFKAYQIFYDVQMAWMNFDYDKLKELLTDELYNNYVMQLDALKLKNHKNTMKGFELIDSYIIDLKEENGKYIAKVYLNVSFYDYIENSNTGVILRGASNRKINNTYILTYIRTKEENSEINICPRCGAPVEGNSTGICEYCKSKLINETHGWIMSEKQKIGQK